MAYRVGKIRFLDDGDHLRGLGCVAQCAAYLEDAMVKIADDLQYTFPKLPFLKNFPSFRLGPNAQAVRKAINRQFELAPKYLYKDYDRHIVNSILFAIEKAAVQRNEAMHSRMLMDKDGRIVREVNKTIRLLTSAEIYSLAEFLSILTEETDILWFAICRLRDHSEEARYYEPYAGWQNDL